MWQNEDEENVVIIWWYSNDKLVILLKNGKYHKSTGAPLICYLLWLYQMIQIVRGTKEQVWQLIFGVCNVTWLTWHRMHQRWAVKLFPFSGNPEQQATLAARLLLRIGATSETWDGPLVIPVFFWKGREWVQGDHSGCFKPPVDTKTNIALLYMFLISKQNFCFGVNERL